MLMSSLRLRAGLYRLASLVPAGDRAARRARAGGFAAAREELAGLDVASLTTVTSPAWPAEGHVAGGPSPEPARTAADGVQQERPNTR
jgi:hypothetical protein